jgi:ribosome-binding protein aMBF1 (putative translation factor)
MKDAIKVADLHRQDMQNPVYRREWEALEGEFALAEMMIRARGDAGLTQMQLAERMRTTQAVVARLESGKVKPSVRTLERFAEATGRRLCITFEVATPT